MSSDNRKLGSHFKKLIFPFENFKDYPFLQFSKLLGQRKDSILSKTKYLLKNYSTSQDNPEVSTKHSTLLKSDESDNHSKKSTFKTKRGGVIDILKKRLVQQSLDSSLPINKQPLVNQDKIILNEYNYNESPNLQKTPTVKNPLAKYEHNYLSQSAKNINKPKSGLSFFMTNINNESTPSNKMIIRNNSSFGLKSIHRSNSFNPKAMTSLQSQCKFICDTVKKSIRESDLFNRNLNIYIDEQRKIKKSHSFVLQKSQKELELEGKYEELTEPLKFFSSSFKKTYCPYKNTKTGDSHIIRQGYAELMKYIDNYARMEDSLTFDYRHFIYKKYPVVQEAADLRILHEDDNEIDKQKKLRDEKMDKSLKQLRDLTISLELKKRKLFNQIEEENIRNQTDRENVYRKKGKLLKRIKIVASDKKKVIK